jgi:hypothetical protein
MAAIIGAAHDPLKRRDHRPQMAFQLLRNR